MTWKEFYAQLKENAPQGVYLFAGPEEYLKREALRALQSALLPAGLEQLNETVLEGATGGADHRGGGDAAVHVRNAASSRCATGRRSWAARRAMKRARSRACSIG